MRRGNREDVVLQNMALKSRPIDQANSIEDHGEERVNSPCETIRDFALNVTTAHGFPNIFRSSSRLGRLLWTVIFLAGFTAAIGQGTMLFLKYFSYPVNVEVSIITKSTLNFPSVTVCNTNKLRHTVVDKSKHRQMLVVDQSASLPYYAPCIDDDFECAMRTPAVCIKKYLLCDGIRQCGEDDPSDENNCNYEVATCTSDFFRCAQSGSSMGLCIPMQKKCDRRRDCYDGEDEDNCECKKNEFRCEKRGGCISKRNVCNGWTNCLDGSDEDKATTCNKTTMFKCNSGQKMIPKSFQCDGNRDCIDESDELYCTRDYPTILIDESPVFECILPTLQCGDNEECYQQSYECDGENDCYNGYDESIEVCGRAAICSSPQVPCPIGGGCGILCDFNPDCVNESDEKNCNCSVFRDNTDDIPVEIVTCAGTHKVYSVDALDSRYWMSCGGTNYRIRTSLYECTEGLDCYKPGSIMPEPCKTVYSDCYLSPIGLDYIGMTNDPNCLPWSHLNVSTTSFNGLDYWQLEGVDEDSTVSHNYCRNPGGVQMGPWCFIANNSGEIVIKHCQVTVPKPPGSTCHNASLHIAVSQDSNPRSNDSQGRLELTNPYGFVGSISNVSWTIDEKNVACRQLGFPAGALVDDRVDFGPGTGPVLITDVQCTGYESQLIDCFYRIVGADDRYADHAQDVGIVCNTRIQSNVSMVDNVMSRDAPLFDPEGRQRRNVDPVSEDRERSDLCTGCSTSAHHPSSSISDTMRKLQAKDGLGPDPFKCQDGQSIPYWQTCNKFPDCPDGSDEWETDLECNVVRACNFYEFQCSKSEGSKCIDKNFVCDGQNDCTNGRRVTEANSAASDERRCPPVDERQPDNYYRCSSGRGNHAHFIPLRDVCNTVSDCVSGEDETMCGPEGRGDETDPFEDPNWYLPYKTLQKGDDFDELLESFTTNYTIPPFHRVDDLDPPNWDRLVTYSAMPDYSDLVDILNLSSDEVSEFGHQKEDFILQCTYEQKKCNISHIHVFQDDKFGNCFKFNDKDLKFLASKTGSRNGLQMTLFLEQSEYISIYGQEAGVRVAITPTHISPKPRDIGITVKPGTVTSIGLRYNDVIRKGSPYGKCKATVKNTSILANGTIRKTTESEKYDRGLCKKTCVHGYIWDKCKCSDTLELDGPRCRLLNTTQDICKQLIYFLYHHDRLDCNCPKQCSDIYYTKTSSMSMWPSKKFVNLLLRNIHSINKKTKHLNQENIFENIARLEIYYEELNYERTQETPAYQVYSLFGDIGGIVGLYIGFSLITVCEFIGLVLKLIKNNCFKTGSRL